MPIYLGKSRTCAPKSKLLSEELDGKEQALVEIQQRPAAEVTPFAEENERLQKELAEKDRLLAELSAKNSHAPKSENDLERYEAELNEVPPATGKRPQQA